MLGGPFGRQKKHRHRCQVLIGHGITVCFVSSGLALAGGTNPSSKQVQGSKQKRCSDHKSGPCGREGLTCKTT